MTDRIEKGDKVYTSKDGNVPEFTRAKFSKDYDIIRRLDELLSKVQGQAFALQAVKEYLFGINNRENSQGVGGLRTFIGPPACGKTFVGEKIAEALNRSYLRLDMSAYNDREVGLLSCSAFNKVTRRQRREFLQDMSKKTPSVWCFWTNLKRRIPTFTRGFLSIFDRATPPIYTQSETSHSVTL